MECHLPSSTRLPHQAPLQHKTAVAAAAGDGPQDQDMFPLLPLQTNPTGEEHLGHGLKEVALESIYHPSSQLLHHHHLLQSKTP